MQTIQHQRAHHIVEHGAAAVPLLEQRMDVQTLDGVELDAAQVQQLGFGDDFLHLGHRHGAVKIVALRVLAVHLQQQTFLFSGLHALGDEADAQHVGHVDDGFQNPHAAAAGALTHLQEFHVQLDDIHGDLPQHVQAGIPAAEIIHQDGQAQPVQAVNGLGHAVRIAHVGGLGDLHLQQAGRQVVGFEKIFKKSHHIDGIHIHAGHVHRAGKGLPAHVQRQTQPFGHMVPDVGVQLGDKAVAFQQRDELSRRDDAPGGMPPADKRLTAHQLAGEHVDLRLHIDTELVVFQTVLHLGEQHVVRLRLMHLGGVIPAHTVHVVVFDGAHRLQRTVIHGADGNGAVRDGENAEGGRKAHVLTKLAHAGGEPFLGVLHRLRAAGQQQRKIIVAKIARHRVIFVDQLHERIRVGVQEPVPLLRAEPLVEQLEMLNVADHDDPVALNGFDFAGHGAQKHGLGVQARDMVDDFPGLGIHCLQHRPVLLRRLGQQHVAGADLGPFNAHGIHLHPAVPAGAEHRAAPGVEHGTGHTRLVLPVQRLIAHIPQPHLRAVFQQRLTELQNMIFIIHKVIRILRLHHQNTYRAQVHKGKKTVLL